MSLEQFLIDFHNTDELYQAYMPFLTYGGIFVKTTRRFPMGTEVTLSLTLPDALEPNVIEGTVVWISEQETQSANPCGVGIGFGEGKAQLQARIEKMLGSKLNSGEATFTM